MDEHYLKENGQTLLVTEALLPRIGGSEIGTLAIMASDLKDRANRSEGTRIAQLYELVIGRMTSGWHCFEGLRRPLFNDGSTNDDKTKLIFAKRPTFDAFTVPGSTPGNPTVLKRIPPSNRTFMVVVSPNTRHRSEYPTICGWINHWDWVEEDPGFPGAPINWIDRFERKVSL